MLITRQPLRSSRGAELQLQVRFLSHPFLHMHMRVCLQTQIQMQINRPTKRIRRSRP